MPQMYSPERGDIVWLEFSPQAGHEQAGHRENTCCCFCLGTSRLRDIYREHQEDRNGHKGFRGGYH